MAGKYTITEQDISEAFAKVENELLESMVRNLERHQIDEIANDAQWAQWQALQIANLREYAEKNNLRYGKQFDELNAQIEALVEEEYRSAYLQQEAKILDAKRDGWEPPEESWMKPSTARLDALIKATHSDMMQAEYSTLRRADDIYRQTIFAAQVYATSGAGTYAKAVDMATKDFLMKGVDGIIYRNGSHHSIRDYSQMAVRTAVKRARLTADGDARRAWGVHTIFVNYRSNACPECMEWVGKVLVDDVYSDGTQDEAVAGGYALLSDAMAAGLFHPNCRDTSSTYFEGISEPPREFTPEEMEQAEQYDRLSEDVSRAAAMEREWSRVAAMSLDEAASSKAQARADVWESKAEPSRLHLSGSHQDMLDKLQEVRADHPLEVTVDDLSLKRGGIAARAGEPVTYDDFFDETTAIFQKAERPLGEPDYISGSGSKYWYRDGGVYRESDHWGARVASCNWGLEGDVSVEAVLDNGRVRYTSSVPMDDDVLKGYRVGYCKLDDFAHNADVLPSTVYPTTDEAIKAVEARHGVTYSAGDWYRDGKRLRDADTDGLSDEIRAYRDANKAKAYYFGDSMTDVLKEADSLLDDDGLRQAIHTYTHGAYHTTVAAAQAPYGIKNTLEGRDDTDFFMRRVVPNLSEESRKEAKVLTDAIDKSTTTATSYRVEQRTDANMDLPAVGERVTWGLRSGTWDEEMVNLWMESTPDGMGAAGMGWDGTGQPVVYEITGKHKALDISSISDFKEQNEVLLRGTYEITDISKVPKTIIDYSQPVAISPRDFADKYGYTFEPWTTPDGRELLRMVDSNGDYLTTDIIRPDGTEATIPRAISEDALDKKVSYLPNYATRDIEYTRIRMKQVESL